MKRARGKAVRYFCTSGTANRVRKRRTYAQGTISTTVTRTVLVLLVLNTVADDCEGTLSVFLFPLSAHGPITVQAIADPNFGSS